MLGFSKLSYGWLIIGLMVGLLALIPDVYGAMSVEGGIQTSSSGGSSVQGIFAADNNGATFLARDRKSVV